MKTGRSSKSTEYANRTDNINKFRTNCDKIEELIKAFIETNQKVLDLSVTMSNNQITNEEYMKNIEEHIFRINVFTYFIINKSL